MAKPKRPNIEGALMRIAGLEDHEHARMTAEELRWLCKWTMHLEIELGQLLPSDKTAKHFHDLKDGTIIEFSLSPGQNILWAVKINNTSKHKKVMAAIWMDNGSWDINQAVAETSIIQQAIDVLTNTEGQE